ncbi:Uncharacterized membrane protein [Ensifer sp. OV372]|nr:Uncharacterized membrane protein [Ensifer sp. OV372]
MMLEDLLRPANVIGAAVLFGTGAGIAFFMLMAKRTRDARLIAHVADTVFTATAVLLQPITGYLLATSIGWSLTEGWIALSLILYVVTGLFWLPVVWIQLRLRDLARLATANGAPLPPEFDRLYAIWFACGFPAFFAVTGIFWLMLMKPQFALF